MDRIENYEINSHRWFSLVNFESEIWKDVKGYEDLYQVSNLGRVKTKYNKVLYKKPFIHYRNRPIMILKQFLGKDRYYRVGLTKNGKCSQFSVHRLVATAFLPNIHHYPCVNHKDENKTNNKISNLEWCSVLYNNNYGTVKARISATHIAKPFNGKAIIIFDKEGKFVSEFPSIRAAERLLLISRKLLKKYKDGRLIGNYIFFLKANYSKDKLEKIVQDEKDYKIVQLTKNGVFVKCYNNIREASDITGINYSQILLCCKHVKKFKTGGGYIWVYYKEYVNEIKPTANLKNFIIKDNAKRKKVHQFDIDGKYIATYASVREASKITHISVSTICEVCNEIGNYVTAGNYIWTYTMDIHDITRKIERARATCKRKVTQYTINGDFVASYTSIQEACEITGISRAIISNCISKKHRTGGGYKWE